MNPLTTAVIQILQHAVFPIIAAVIAGFITVLINKISKRFHLGNLTEMHSFLLKVATSAVGLAEEKGVAALKANGVKLTSNAKLDIAIAHMLRVVPTIDRETADKYAHIALSIIPGVGATGNNRKRRPRNDKSIFYSSSC